MIATLVAVICALVAAFAFYKWQHFRTRALLAEEKYTLAEKGRAELAETFKALSHDALERNSRSFIDLASASLEKYQERAKGDLDKRQQAIDQLVKPVNESLTKLDLGLRALEKERKGDYSSLKTQVNLLKEAEDALKKETSNLVKALRTPHIRGRWGEMQLRRVVELAGMVKHCDFVEQEGSSDGGKLRPDLIVRLAGGRQVIIDSKAPLEPYLDAMQEEQEEKRVSRLNDYARGVRGHILQLARKSYHEHFTPTPEFVILFLPSEHFLSVALQQDASLIEMGAEKGVILATPTTLIALLRSVAYGWKQENLSRHAQKVSELGSELYKRLIDMSGHFTKMGRSLTSAVEAYNRGVGSLESRVLVTGRKFQDLGAASTQLDVEEVTLVEKTPRELQNQSLSDS